MNPIDLAQHVGNHPVWFLATALVLGALHGLEPGHSKGIMAAFIVGTRGTYGQAVILALCATLSHTAVVWLLAWPASFGGMIWSGAQLSPYLNLISGIVVLALSYWMLRRYNHAHGHDHHHGHSDAEHGDDHPPHHDHDEEHDPHEHDPSHFHHHHEHDQDFAHDHAHGHGPDGGHTHAGAHATAEKADIRVDSLTDDLALEDEHARFHAREIAERFGGHEVSTAQVATFGLSTGLAPCSAAIVILITCFRLHQPGLGMGLVACFSLGLGLMLTSVALLASWGMRTVGRRSQGFQEIVEKAPFLSALVTAAIGLYLIVQFFRSY